MDELTDTEEKLFYELHTLTAQKVEVVRLRNEWMTSESITNEETHDKYFFASKKLDEDIIAFIKKCKSEK